MSNYVLSIGDLVARTGVAESTLRIWERRYGFPEPQRTASGHRRYSEADVRRIEQVLVGRELGLSLPAAIERVLSAPDGDQLSLFAQLRRLAPEPALHVLSKPAMVVLSNAIEDEMLARAERQLLFACFQRERFYRQSQRRWRQLAGGAEVAAVFADFAVPRAAADGPAEIPISRSDPLTREWALIAYGERSTIAMTGRERASSDPERASLQRTFEVIWTVDPTTVRALAHECADLAARAVPAIARQVTARLAEPVLVSPSHQLELSTAVINRVLSNLPVIRVA